MSKNIYFPLHLHTTYSVLDAVPLPSEWALVLKERDFSGGGIADHGTLAGIWKFQKHFDELGLKSVLGIEVYVVDEYKKVKDRGHLTIFFKSERGFSKFLEYHRKAYEEGFYYKPRFLVDDIFQLEDIVLLSGCVYSPFLDDEELVKKAIDRFGSDFYLELSVEPSDLRKQLNEYLVKVRKKYNVKFCFTLDAHFIDKDDSEVRRVLKMLNLGKTYKDFKESDNYFIKLLTEEEINFLVSKYHQNVEEYLSEAFESSFEVAEKCNFKLKKYDFSEFLFKHSFDDFMKLFEGKEIEYRERFEKELSVYKQRRFYDYLMMILKIIEIAKNKDIFVYPRGSVGGSYIAYLLDIVPYNPIQFGLLFERFLTAEREDPPDIDLDIEHKRRDELIDELKKEFDVILLSTFGTFKEKQALRDVGRVYGVSEKDMSEGLRKLAQKLVGRIRFRGRHGVGFLLFSKFDDRYKKVLPLERVSDEIVCAFDVYDLNEIGVPKFDLLYSCNLTIIKETLRKAGRNVENPFKAVLRHLDKVEVFDEIYKKKKLAGIHMFDTEVARDLVEKLSLDSFTDLINFLAFDRPGPLKNYLGKVENVSYPDFIQKYLGETKGLFLFQEQIMLVLKELGYSDKEIHKCRKAIGKKLKNELEKFGDDVKKRLRERGVSDELAKKVWNDILEFSGYAFNKAHAVSYALLSFLMAVLKYRFKEIFYETVFRYILEQGPEPEKKLKNLIKEVLSEGYKIKLPSFSEPVGYVKYNDEGNYFRLGVAFVKGVGDKLAEKLDGVKYSFRNFDDFVKRLRPTALAVKSLGQVGFFDGVYPRKFIYENYKELSKGTSLFIDVKNDDWNDEEKRRKLLEVMPFLNGLLSIKGSSPKQLNKEVK